MSIPGTIYLLIVSAVLWTIALRLFIRQITFLHRSRPTRGQLIDWTPRGSSGGRSCWYPVVRYTAPDGHTHEVRGNTGRSRARRPDIPPHRTYPVRYLIADPSRAQIATLFHYWLAPIALTVLAVGATVACGHQAALW